MGKLAGGHKWQPYDVVLNKGGWNCLKMATRSARTVNAKQLNHVTSKIYDRIHLAKEIPVPNVLLIKDYLYIP